MVGRLRNHFRLDDYPAFQAPLLSRSGTKMMLAFFPFCERLSKSREGDFVRVEVSVLEGGERDGGDGLEFREFA